MRYFEKAIKLLLSKHTRKNLQKQSRQVKIEINDKLNESERSDSDELGNSPEVSEREGRLTAMDRSDAKLDE